MSTGRTMIEKVYDALGDGPLDTNQIAAKVGAFPWDVQTICRKLLQRERIKMIGRRPGAPAPNIWERAGRRVISTYTLSDSAGTEFTMQIVTVEDVPVSPGVEALLMQLTAKHADKSDFGVAGAPYKVVAYHRELQA